MLTARIIGTGSYLPEKVIDNIELAKRVPNKSKENDRGFDEEAWKRKLSEEGIGFEKLSRDYFFSNWADRVSGTDKRHIFNNIFDTPKNFRSCSEEMGAEASKKALEMSGIKTNNLDCIIMCTFTPHYQVPNAAASVGHLIGKNKGHESITINTACTGFIQGLLIGYRAIRSRDHRNVLVVASETLSKVTNYNDAKTSILFADGAGAAVLRADNNKGILWGFADTEYSTRIALEEDVGYVVIGDDGKTSEVLRKAVRAMEIAERKVLEKTNLSLEDIAYLIPHQANQRITKSLIEKLRFPEEKTVKTIKEFGNTSAASVAIALDKAIRGEIENIRIQDGDKLLLTAFAGGYTSAGMVLEY